MRIITKLFDDNSASVMDLSTYRIDILTNNEIAKMIKNNQIIIGVIQNDKRIVAMMAYDICEFPSYDDAIEYMQSNGVQQRLIRENDKVFMITRNDKVIHVEYMVYSHKGSIKTYVCKEGKYSEYIQSAEGFTRQEAEKKAAIMTAKSKTGTKWFVEKIIC